MIKNDEYYINLGKQLDKYFTGIEYAISEKLKVTFEQQTVKITLKEYRVKHFWPLFTYELNFENVVWHQLFNGKPVAVNGTCEVFAQCYDRNSQTDTHKEAYTIKLESTTVKFKPDKAVFEVVGELNIPYIRSGRFE